MLKHSMFVFCLQFFEDQRPFSRKVASVPLYYILHHSMIIYRDAVLLCIHFSENKIGAVWILIFCVFIIMYGQMCIYSTYTVYMKRSWPQTNAVRAFTMNWEKKRLRESIISLLCALICICSHRCWALTRTIHVIRRETWDETLCKWARLSLQQGRPTFIPQKRTTSHFDQEMDDYEKAFFFF